MSFTMGKDGHEIEMNTDPVWGLEIIDIKCPYKEQLEVIADWWYGEAQRFKNKNSKISFTYDRFRELMQLTSLSQLIEKGEEMPLMKKEEWDAIPTIKKLKEKWPLKYNRLLEHKGSICLSCGYEPEEFEGLYRGYGCPGCHSPFVVTISEVRGSKEKAN